MGFAIVVVWFPVFLFFFFPNEILCKTLQTNGNISSAPWRELSPPFSVSSREGEFGDFFHRHLWVGRVLSHWSYAPTHSNSRNKAPSSRQCWLIQKVKTSLWYLGMGDIAVLYILKSNHMWLQAPTTWLEGGPGPANTGLLGSGLHHSVTAWSCQVT